jgi:hypothetical protein
MGEIVYGGCLCKSTSYDAWIFEDSKHLHPQYIWELNLGDCHFSTCAQFLTPAQAVAGRVLTPVETTWNNMLQMPRARIEHINRVIKNHMMFSGQPYRGWVRNLKVFVNISIHAAAVELRNRARESGPRYAGFGPWAH